VGGPALAARITRFVAGVAAAAVILAFSAWFDTTVIAGAQRASSSTFDVTPYGLAFGVGSVVVAGLVLAVAAIGWQCRSIGLGIVYLTIGGLFAFLVYLMLAVGAAIASPNGPSPLFDLLSVLSNLNASTMGPLNAVSIVGGGMAIIGIAQIATGLVKLRASRRSAGRLAESEEPRGTIEEVVDPA
jgi:hypothetical protein